MFIWIRNTICYLRTGTPRKFADLRFADQSYKFADLRFADWHYLRNLRICDCEMSPRICGFAICGEKKNFVPRS